MAIIKGRYVEGAGMSNDPIVMEASSPHWIEDSTKWRGEVLAGKYAHWCDDWDSLPTDETCMEFLACTCYEETLDIRGIKVRLRMELDKQECMGHSWQNSHLGATEGA